ncbi:uncharacterized protein TNCV_1962541 [Trichonephila clavipes]|nr:uncharacterized protein TNCV_1962541 [Trichonephila clavipes]
MIRKLEEGCTVTSVAAEFGINKSVVSRAWKAFQTTGTAVSSYCRRKEAQSASVIAQQRSDKCRGLLWPDAFTKGAYSPAVLNAAPVES